jgi:hypothetical protein
MSKKILLFRGSPRSNIPEVEQWNKKLPCDNLVIRYVPEIKAYHWARDYFLDNDYDYLAIATDDIVVKPEHIEQLQKDIDEIDLPVISGYMNVDEKDYPDGYHNIAYDLALQDRKLRYWNWLMPKDLPKSNIFRVKFAGFGLTAIRRDIMEQYTFAGDGYIRDPRVAEFEQKLMDMENGGLKETPEYDDAAGQLDNILREGIHMKGASLDLVFAWDCHWGNIPIYCDKRIKMQHLRAHGTHRIGERPSRAYLYKDGQEIDLGKIKY